MKSVISFIKKYPKSIKITLSLLGLGLICVLTAGSAASIICGVLFVADVIYVYKSGGAGDQ